MGVVQDNKALVAKKDVAALSQASVEQKYGIFVKLQDDEYRQAFSSKLGAQMQLSADDSRLKDVFKDILIEAKSVDLKDKVRVDNDLKFFHDQGVQISLSDELMLEGVLAQANEDFKVGDPAIILEKSRRNVDYKDVIQASLAYEFPSVDSKGNIKEEFQVENFFKPKADHSEAYKIAMNSVPIKTEMKMLDDAYQAAEDDVQSSNKMNLRVNMEISEDYKEYAIRAGDMLGCPVRDIAMQVASNGKVDKGPLPVYYQTAANKLSELIRTDKIDTVTLFNYANKQGLMEQTAVLMAMNQNPARSLIDMIDNKLTGVVIGEVPDSVKNVFKELEESLSFEDKMVTKLAVPQDDISHFSLPEDANYDMAAVNFAYNASKEMEIYLQNSGYSAKVPRDFTRKQSDAMLHNIAVQMSEAPKMAMSTEVTMNTGVKPKAPTPFDGATASNLKPRMH